MTTHYETVVMHYTILVHVVIVLRHHYKQLVICCTTMNSWEIKCYDDRLDKEQGRGTYTYKEKSS